MHTRITLGAFLLGLNVGAAAAAEQPPAWASAGDESGQVTPATPAARSEPPAASHGPTAPPASTQNQRRPRAAPKANDGRSAAAGGSAPSERSRPEPHSEPELRGHWGWLGLLGLVGLVGLFRRRERVIEAPERT